MKNNVGRKSKYECCGCAACASVCPVKAVTMLKDKEGFFYPVVDNERCINCGRCLKTCSFSDIFKEEIYSDCAKKPKVYAVIHKDESTRKESRSGGIFTAVTDCILTMKGVIYGCALINKFTAKHIRAANKAARDKMRKSKYIQSETTDVFEQIRKDLVEGKVVLFSGTSCQVAAIKKYCLTLSINMKNLICLDILCHGCPSPLFWKRYINDIEKRFHGIVEDIQFRDKEHFGWKDHVESMKIGDILYSSKDFADIFYSHMFLRPSCYRCHYKSIMHPSDITIGDFWRVEKTIPEFNDNKGVSLVLINSEKGAQLFDAAKKDIKYKESSIEASKQQTFVSPYPEPKMRKLAWFVFRWAGVKGSIYFVHMRRKLLWTIRKILFR